MTSSSSSIAYWLVKVLGIFIILRCVAYDAKFGPYGAMLSLILHYTIFGAKKL
jgi:hypothetical protein